METSSSQVVVIGSGPNGLTAAVVLARAGLSVIVHEAARRAGGGARSEELTLPGFVHDLFSAVHPMARTSAAFRDIGLEVDWVEPDAALAHPFDDGTALLLERSIESTCAALDRDGRAWDRLLRPFVSGWTDLQEDLFRPIGVPRHPALAAKFGLSAMMSATRMSRAWFKSERTKALFAGLAAHSGLPLDMRPSAAYGLVLAAAGHAVGWPLPRGGAQRISDALVERLRDYGGKVRTSSKVDSLPDAPLVMCDIGPPQFLALASHRAKGWYNRRLASFRYGPGAFKLDWALDGPIPWKAPECARAATVHLGGTFEEIAASERIAWDGFIPHRPFVILTQPTLFDPSRAPAGKHIAWAYCHVANGSSVDATERIEAQVERFAPGFGRRILARRVMPAAVLHRLNANLVGGDVNGGAADQLFMRPTALHYSTTVPGVYLCSASTPPGGGVHGMCGWHAARRALHDLAAKK